jgi:transcriptional regulator with XRE-family HTH domain
MEAAVEIGERVRQRRDALKLTQEQLAAETGVTPQHVSRIENGLNEPSLDLLVRLAQSLGVTADFLLTGAEPPELNVRGAIRSAPTLDADAKRLVIELVERLGRT